MREICLLRRGSEVVSDSEDDAYGGSMYASVVLQYRMHMRTEIQQHRTT